MVLYFAANEPTIDVTMTIAAMVVPTSGDPYRTASAIENSPLPMVFAQISRPDSADPWMTIPVIRPEMSLLTMARTQMTAMLKKFGPAGEIHGDPEKDEEDYEEDILERPGMLLEGIGIGRGKCHPERDHHHGLRDLEHDRKGCRGQDCGKREDDREFVIPVEDGDEELLAVMGKRVEYYRAHAGS